MPALAAETILAFLARLVQLDDEEAAGISAEEYRLWWALSTADEDTDPSRDELKKSIEAQILRDSSGFDETFEAVDTANIQSDESPSAASSSPAPEPRAEGKGKQRAESPLPLPAFGAMRADLEPAIAMLSDKSLREELKKTGGHPSSPEYHIAVAVRRLAVRGRPAC